MNLEASIENIQIAILQLVAAQKETDRKFRETDQKFKETAEQFKATDKKIDKVLGQFTTMWGKLVESLVEGDLIRILQDFGISVHDTSQRRKGNHLGQNFEFDIIAHNGIEIVIVEVKTNLTVSDVNDFLKKLSMAKTWLDEYSEYTIYGAVAYLQAEGSAQVYAENQGLLVVRATGNSASITNGSGFRPKKF